MNALSEFVSKVTKPAKLSKGESPPTQRTVAELQAALAAAEAVLPEIDANEGLLALDAADGKEGAEAALQKAADSRREAIQRVQTLRAAIKAASERENAASSKARAEIRATQIANVQRFLKRREREAEALTQSLTATIQHFRALFDLSDRARIAWPGGRAPAGTALNLPEITAMIEGEIFRLGGSAFVGGGQGVTPSFPGGKQTDFRIPPDKMPSLVQLLAQADDFGVQNMIGGKP